MKYTFKDFQRDFPTEDVCLDYIFKQKYPEVTKYYKVTGRKCYASTTGHQIHPLKGTIFEKSSTSLTIWFYAIYQFSTSKNGVSAKKLQRDLGVTYKCAWRIAKKIRELMSDDGITLSGIVEADETYIGGKKNAQGGKGKEQVMGMVERHGKIKTVHIPARRGSTLLGQIERTVQKGSKLMTDEYAAYKALEHIGYPHESVLHARKEYVRGDVYTNTIEGYWSQLKRSIHGTYHSVSPKHLQTYVDEFSYRYNRRASQLPVFFHLLNEVVG